MAIVNFSVPKQLEKRIGTTIKEKGFPSKAELFRFAVIRYLDETEIMPFDKNRRLTNLSEQLEMELKKKIGKKPLPSLRKQLARVKRL
ncbi:MAG: ribbon-helix-helix domain-containing protein [Patescibacteria group bacterium]